MNRIIVATLILASSYSFASAEDITSKVMNDLPGVTGRGVTVNPTAKINDGSLSAKAMKDWVGVTGRGRTANPTAHPHDGGLSDAAMLLELGANG
jgi:hypothetical protein